ncbi:MAG: sarcosine oxidase subunit delta [Rhizobiaceae bacterium]
MRITCPHCGPRDLAEFYYWGDAARTSPDLGSGLAQPWLSHVYDRANPRGRHKEHWQHLGGCRAYLLVERDTLTHEVFSAIFARDAQKPKARGAKK